MRGPAGVHPARAGYEPPAGSESRLPGLRLRPSLRRSPAELCRPAGLTPPPLPYPVLGRNAAGKDAEGARGSVLEQTFPAALQDEVTVTRTTSWTARSRKQR